MTEPLAQDDAIVMAALEFIDSFDSDDSIAECPTLTAKRRRVHSGQRVRGEIQRLRASVVELEARIRSLKKREGTPSHGPTNALLLRSWQEVARRQKSQCQRVYAENQRLRALLIDQTRVARKLERAAARSRQVETTGPVCTDRVSVAWIERFHTIEGATQLTA